MFIALTQLKSMNRANHATRQKNFFSDKEKLCTLCKLHRKTLKQKHLYGIVVASYLQHV